MGDGSRGSGQLGTEGGRGERAPRRKPLLNSVVGWWQVGSGRSVGLGRRGLEKNEEAVVSVEGAVSHAHARQRTLLHPPTPTPPHIQVSQKSHGHDEEQSSIPT